jgi:hypothetical protein
MNCQQQQLRTPRETRVAAVSGSHRVWFLSIQWTEVRLTHVCVFILCDWHHAHAGGNWEGVLRPKQSWQVCGLEDVNVSISQPLVVAACLRGVTRVDAVERYALEAVMQQGGQGCILLERMVHEVAYKLARAPKYGS